MGALSLKYSTTNLCIIFNTTVSKWVHVVSFLKSKKWPNKPQYRWYTQQNTVTGRCTPRPNSCSLTSTCTVSHQAVVACVTTVVGCLSKCCSSCVINLAIGWISQIATVHNCQKYNTSCKSMLLDTSTQHTMYRLAPQPFRYKTILWSASCRWTSH